MLLYKEKIPWTRYYLPDDHKYFTFLKKVFRHEFRKNWFRRISTPIFEHRDIITQAFSKDPSILEKNLFCLDADICLRMDPSIWVLKSYISWELNTEIQPVYLYHMDRYFRRDSSLNSWLNEYYIIWGEIIWENDPILDAILVYITFMSLNKIWLGNTFNIKINSIWNQKELDKYVEELKNFYSTKKHLLTPESLDNLEKNPLKLLKSKNDDEMILASQAPKLVKFLKKDSKGYFEKFQEYLNMLNIPYEIDNNLIPLFPFYNDSLWTFKNIETDEEISFWWRYNTLSKILGAQKEIPATWFWIKVLPLIEMLKAKNISIKNKDELDLYFVQLWDEAKKLVFNLSLQAREKWIKVMVSLWTPSIKEQMIKAQRTWAKFVVMVGVMEARNGRFQVRDMVNWTQEEVLKDNIIDYIIWKIWTENLDFYSPEKDFIIK